MSHEREKQIAERVETIRKQEGMSNGRGPEDVTKEALDPEDAEVVSANKSMKRQVGGKVETADPQLAAGLAAEGVRMNSTDRAKHSAPGSDEQSLDEASDAGPGGRYADR